jgi:hypothetical protein
VQEQPSKLKEEGKEKFFKLSSSFDANLLARRLVLVTSRKKLLFTLKFHIKQLRH